MSFPHTHIQNNSINARQIIIVFLNTLKIKQLRKKSKEKKVVYISIWKFLLQVFSAGLFTVVGIIVGNSLVAVFFSLSWLFVLYPLFDRNSKVRWYAGTLFSAMDEDFLTPPKNFAISEVDPGIFTYTESGFEVTQEGVSYSQNWSDIKTMVAYKLDNLTTDSICISVFCDNDIQFGITEETAGFGTFISKTNKQFPQINKAWIIDIMSPAFRMNLMLLYDRDGRTLEDVTKEHYPKK